LADAGSTQLERASYHPVIPGGVERRPGIHAMAVDPRRGIWIPASAGMTREHGHWLMPAPRNLRGPTNHPVIPGGVKRRPGIQATADDPRRGIWIPASVGMTWKRGYWLMHAPHSLSRHQTIPLFWAEWNGDPESRLQQLIHAEAFGFPLPWE